MKKYILFLIVALFECMGNMFAADGITATDIVIPQGGSAVLEIQLNSTDLRYGGFQFDITLPQGISMVKMEKAERLPENFFVNWALTNQATNTYTFAGMSMEGKNLEGESGAILYLTLAADAQLEEGATMTATLGGDENVISTYPDLQQVFPESTQFTITIGAHADSRMILDETSTVMPEAAMGVDVHVKRTLTANVWNTIVLPFPMTSQQVGEAFGDGVQLADFTGSEIDEDENGDITGIAVQFQSVNAIEANHPYIIKVKEPISEFTVDGVDIDPEDEPTNAVIKRTKKQWSEMIGTYVANTVVEDDMLFLNGNKFWYSTGQTVMMGYRAYFDFYDVLTSVENADAKVTFEVNGETTDITGVAAPHLEGEVYNVQGLHMGKDADMKRLPKGVYIVNGKKVTVK